jgi:hypothetical protein
VAFYHFAKRDASGRDARGKTQLQDSMSLTDSCIGWETTERMLRWGYKKLTKAAQSVISAAQPIHSL